VITKPDRGVLEGITRRTVIEMAQSRGIPVQLATLSADALRASDEVFLSTSGGGVLPVTKVDGRAIGTGSPGSVTQSLTALYWDWHQDPRYSTVIDYS